MNPKIVFVDIDGTLFCHETGIPKSALEAIDLARKNHHKVFINTGRTKSAVDDYLKFYPFDGFIYAAGGSIEINDSFIYQVDISHQDIKQAIELFDRYQLGFILEGVDVSYYNQKGINFFKEKNFNRWKDIPPQVRRHLLQENTVIDVKYFWDDPKIINKFSLFASSHQEVLDFQTKFLKDYDFIVYTTTAEIIKKGINKAFGMKKVCDYYNIDMKDTVAIGDSMNDYEMIQQAGFGIVMDSAPETLKQVADYVTFTTKDHGLYHGFKKAGLID